MPNAHIVEEHVYWTIGVTAIITVLFFIPALGDSALTSSVTRSLSSNSVTTGSTITVRLTITNAQNDNFILIEDIIPDGFTITDYGGSSSTQSGVLRWADISTPVANRTLSYTVQAPSSSGVYLFSGQYLSENMANTAVTGGEDTISVTGSTTTTSTSGGGGGGGGGG